MLSSSLPREGWDVQEQKQNDDYRKKEGRRPLPISSGPSPWLERTCPDISP
jgi:hypothetical protein